MQPIIIIWRKRLASYLAFVAIASFIALTIGWRYPIEREILLAPYTNGVYEYEFELPTYADQVDEVGAALKPGHAMLGQLTGGTVTAVESGRESSADMVFTGTPENADLSLLPDTSRIAGDRDTWDDAWIDMGHSLAHDLGVQVGDLVEIPLGLTDAEPQFRVRGIYAVTGTDGQRIALFSSPEVLKHYTSARGEDELFYAWSADIPLEQVNELSSMEPFSTRLRVGGVPQDRWTLESREDRLNHVLDYTSYGLGLIKTLAVISVVLIVAVFFREARHASSQFGDWVGLFGRLGVPERSLRWRVYWLYALGGTAAVLLGGVGAYAVASGWFTSYVLPPTLRGEWFGSVALVAALPFVFFTVLLPWRTRRKQTQ